MTNDTARLRRDLAETRDRISDDITELRDRAKHRLDVARMVREHPWSAVGAAVVLGAVIGGSGADERALSVAKDAAARTIERVRSRTQHHESRARVVEERRAKPGIGTRVAGMVGATIASTLDRVLDEMRVASREWGARLSTPRARTHAAPAPVAAVAAAIVERNVATDRAADTVPVPNEIAPAELGLRADAVEAVGGGTHEPPLEEGAGELGARWS
jgi:hypothetical protein